MTELAEEWKPSPAQVELMRYALGIHRSDREYRNHFFTGPGSPGFVEWQDLVERGYATRQDPTPVFPDYVFSVTDAGRHAVAAPTNAGPAA